ncbi:MAG: D-alanyl-D-alanine carboxypeptidase/D-alanyl-D-alanine-endopeptidase, partial [Actinobacteria bacterium]|nr:D-alanyl-D-alanine carboxypeptidase/D-alanyl-D-alanine-endopeptidase [Actinomycetota bacterium]
GDRGRGAAHPRAGHDLRHPGRRRRPRRGVVGGGDPFLERRPDADAEPDRADLATLARRTARALREVGVRSIRLGYDDGLFSGPSWNPTWPETYRGDVIAPITALMVDDGRPAEGSGRSLDPSYAAADSFAALLRQRGIRIVGVPRESAAPDGATPLAQVESAPVGQLVDRLLQVSDNETAEVLLRHVGLATGGAGSTKDGVAGVREVLEELGVGVPRRLRDGSGLSRDNLIAPETLVGLLQVAASSEQSDPLRGLFPGLPVAGFSGSLTFRFDDAPPAAVGRVRAKTGTLRGVRSLAGLVVSRDGTPMVFALMADRIAEEDDETAEAVLDRAAAALAACRCGRAG